MFGVGRLMCRLLFVLMNFFFLDRDPKRCARYHGDKHLNKMQVEYAQILSFVWYRVVFDRLDELSTLTACLSDDDAVQKMNMSEFQNLVEVHLLLKNVEMLKGKMYKRAKSHLNHPVVKWASESRAHYLAVVKLGLALCEEKRRRIRHMETLPVAQRKPWKLKNASEDVLQFLQANVPPRMVFPKGDDWTDPPKCMPDYFHKDEHGQPLSVVQSYRLFYAGHKVKIAHLSWEPYVENPDFLEECQAYIRSRPDMIRGIENDLQKLEEKKLKQTVNRKRQKVEKLD